MLEQWSQSLTAYCTKNYKHLRKMTLRTKTLLLSSMFSVMRNIPFKLLGKDSWILLTSQTGYARNCVHIWNLIYKWLENAKTVPYFTSSLDCETLSAPSAWSNFRVCLSSSLIEHGSWRMPCLMVTHRRKTCLIWKNKIK